MDDLKKLMAEVDGRTIEPKPYAPDDGYGPNDVWLMASHPLKGAYNMADGVSKDDAALIVAAVNALPELLALREEVGRLRKALRPFVLLANLTESDPSGSSVMVNVNRCREARAALNQETERNAEELRISLSSWGLSDEEIANIPHGPALNQETDNG